MIKYKEYRNSKKINQTTIVLTMLAMIVLFLKVYSIEVGFGLVIDLSSIVLFLILIKYGKSRALIITIGTCFINILFFHGRYIELVQVLEIYVVYRLSMRYSNKNLMLSDVVFWIIIGIPVTYLCHFIVSGEFFNQYYSFELVFKLTNCIFNAFLSEVIYVYYLKKRLNKEKELIPLKDITVHILIAAILIPFIFNIVLDVMKVNVQISSNVEIDTQEVFDNLEDELSTWESKNIVNLQLSAMVEKLKLQESIRVHSRYKPFNIHIINPRGSIILDVKNNEIDIVDYSEYEKYKEYSDHLYTVVKKLRKFEIANINWLNSFYIYDREILGGKFRLVIEVPVILYKQNIIEEYINQFKFLVLFIIFMLTITFMINKVLFNNLAVFSYNLRDFNKILDEKIKIQLPKSNIFEINELSINIEKLIKELRYNFQGLKKSEKRLYELAYYDSLTMLPNRLNFKKSVEEIIDDGVGDKKICIIFLDLNRFKIINDTLGHEIGDKLLCEVSNRLKELVGPKLKVFRLGGDEFVIVVEIECKEEINQIEGNIKSKFQKYFILEDKVLNVSCSLGASIYPDDSSNISNIIQYADIAMFMNKESGSNSIRIFDEKIKEIVFEKLTIEKEIFNALEKDEFTLFYQGKYDAKTEKIKGLEALIRWTNKELGIVPPDKFIPIAEESDLILKIDKWVLFNACKENKKLQDLGVAQIPISVNISAKYFATNEIERVIKEALEVTGLDPKYLIIEITEGVLIRNFEVVEQVINNLKRLGVLVSIDDFGKGYSSFNQLMRLPISEVKIDKCFIDDIELNKKKESIVRSMVELAHRLELNVVAEGIETEVEKRYIQEIGCDELQGYLFSRPERIDKINFS